MNLITCDQNCRHQQDGYCALNHITRLTGDVTAKCGYFEASRPPAKNKVPGSLPHNPNSL